MRGLIFGQTVLGALGLHAPAAAVARPGGTPHVPDAAARYALTGIAPGYRCVQDDDGLTYEYTGPNDALAGYSVSGGRQDQDAVITIRPSFGLIGGKPVFVVAGILDAEADDSGNGFWRWYSPSLSDNFGAGPDVPGWGAKASDGAYLAYSPDDVATPDLCSTWYDADSNQPVALTFVPVTQGELDPAANWQVVA